MKVEAFYHDRAPLHGRSRSVGNWLPKNNRRYPRFIIFFFQRLRSDWSNPPRSGGKIAPSSLRSRSGAGIGPRFLDLPGSDVLGFRQNVFKTLENYRQLKHKKASLLADRAGWIPQKPSRNFKKVFNFWFVNFPQNYPYPNGEERPSQPTPHVICGLGFAPHLYR